MEDENRSIAYLKMDENPSTELKSYEDYLRWSENCLNEANAYFEVSSRCKDMFLSEYKNAFLTNVSFACELYLKYLLLKQYINCRKEHNLYKLYKKLPEKIQEDLKKKHPCGNISIDEFELELDNIGQAYMIFRYIYERGNRAYNFQFLMELLFTLHSVIHYNKKCE
ncbi:HEPN domain-containing protein [Salicibibacter cibi]|uniref:HEPN domain-containing protein n=1 Tax=Salicibibacter cibi TaxID=2743001 RepID=A0A7T6ZAL2_9BACI|nr:HEPN domain-containing protein [Salicibibacter cibi]QQK79935.1 HEPN domain-containing protein [Salicibibacter cibi]